MFSNCGAGDVGYRRAGFSFEVMAELDPRRLAIALLNHPGACGVAGDVRETWPDLVHRYRERAGDEPPALLAACPPCQGMSSARGRRGEMDDADSGSADERNLLVLPIAQVAFVLRPRTIVVENVPAFLKRKVRHPNSGEPVSAARLLASILAPQYVAFPFLVDLADYGVPQTRKRSFLTFVRHDEAGLNSLAWRGLAPYPRPTHAGSTEGRPHVTITEALTGLNLHPLSARQAEAACDPSGNRLHEVPVWNDHRYDMVAAIPPNSGATAWENDECPNCHEREADTQAATCGSCGAVLLRPVFQEEDGSWRLIKGFRTSSYKRMRPDEPAATITTATGHLGSHATIHPWENRLLSTLECAHLQTFPDDFRWGTALDLWGHSNVRAMIGEAVPPRFTHLHGLALRGVVTGEWAVEALTRGDRRCTTARTRLLGKMRAP
jgi:DNA (cytosine-5)-methyltransferase 1